MARKNHEFTFTKISVRAPESKGEVVSMLSMRHSAQTQVAQAASEQRAVQGKTSDLCLAAVGVSRDAAAIGLSRIDLARIGLAWIGLDSGELALCRWVIDASDGVWLWAGHQWLQSTASSETEVTGFYESWYAASKFEGPK